MMMQGLMNFKCTNRVMKYERKNMFVSFSYAVLKGKVIGFLELGYLPCYKNSEHFMGIA
jgi:CRISPR/Cas system-associated endonuclease Cas1